MKNKMMRFGAKTVALILVIVLAVGSLVGGTVAWLITKTDPVVNTFTYGDINITLDETDVDNDGNALENTYEMVPGSEIVKDPVVTVLKGSEACWLFVKLEKNGGATVDGTTYDFDDYLTYEMASGWTQLVDANGDPVEGVFYREVDAIPESGADAEFNVLKDDKVQVKGEVTKEMMNALDAVQGSETYPTLTVTAYGVQKANIDTVQEAWALIDAEYINPAPPATTAP